MEALRPTLWVNRERDHLLKNFIVHTLVCLIESCLCLLQLSKCSYEIHLTGALGSHHKLTSL